ncbi:DUF2808 domain-containing protein [Sphaerospermopsis kisseleviana CS-549]|uniref:DUF2808 domain-containing protein n=1 Tax=Sphaerospermopsis kisseleviana CS-549 TaxID=3021783 RepID=A0ABT4ZKX3_9CYAN|nr:DUF2808 domain-containing protein [Sphaerospermopsis kisseleviana]MDB9440043.1 DUF2808 domain-containing protein [Sphaerospermopsis kisseleviana CS-549]BAZ83527.1 hypothetical protein NIES73_48160 [Sphaerospermopsis kisseleviana NIES-73]
MNNFKTLGKTLCKTLAISTGIFLLSVPTTYGIPPKPLLTAKTTYNQTGSLNATYYFTIKLPESLANWQLQQVVLTQIEGVENIEFDQKNSFAFVEASGQKEKVGINLTKSSTQPQTIIATFDKPVSANQTIIIVLKPFYNPTSEGIYIFRVHVISSDEKANNLVVGTARFQFYNSFDYHLFYQW